MMIQRTLCIYISSVGKLGSYRPLTMFLEASKQTKEFGNKNLENKGLGLYTTHCKTFCKPPNVSELLFPNHKMRVSASLLLLMFPLALTFPGQSHFMGQRIITINNDLFLLENKHAH